MLLWFLALGPILSILALMLGLRQGAHRAGLAGWLIAVILAVAAFGAGPELLAVALGKSLLLSAYVLYIVWMALLLYHTLNEAGAIRAIGAGLTSLTTDRTLQALLLAWTFGAFLQGVSGYGVPTAVVAPLILSVGFSAPAAVVMAGLGHAWAVTYGSLAASFVALVAASGQPAAVLAMPAAAMLGLACLACGLAVAFAAGGLSAVLRSWWFVLVVGIVMSGVQAAFAAAGLYPVAAISAGLMGLSVASVLARVAGARAPAAIGAPPAAGAARPMPLWLALAPYGLLVTVIGAAEFVPALGRVLHAAQVRVLFPAVQTAAGYITPAELGRSLSVFGHPGALLAYTALLAAWAYARRGCFSPGARHRILRSVLRGALLPSLGIASMVAMAATMEHAGMTRLLAEGMAGALGTAFPLAAPFIGALGAFMTGSNTNSNVVFASLQQDTALLLGLSPAIILAAQTTGGALGAAFAPAKVIVGCSTVGLAGQEGGVLRRTLAYGTVLLALVGLATVLAAGAAP
jgi:lactate permease